MLICESGNIGSRIERMDGLRAHRWSVRGVLQVMMYMTGSSVSIISIMIVGMCLVNSVKSLGAVNKRKYGGVGHPYSDAVLQRTSVLRTTVVSCLALALVVCFLDDQASRGWTTARSTCSCPS